MRVVVSVKNIPQPIFLFWLYQKLNLSQSSKRVFFGQQGGFGVAV
jgi:hypothetical protein